MSLATAAMVAAGTAAAAAYVDAKFHLSRDARLIYNIRKGEKLVERAVKEKRVSMFYRFEDSVQKMPDEALAVWSREGCYTWKEAYAQVLRFGQFFLSHDVKPTNIVAFYLTNSPNFMFAMFGAWTVGAAPALINFHLAGDALVHCVKLSGAKELIVDGDAECRQRIEEVRGRIENDLGIRITILDDQWQANLNSSEPIRPPDSLREMITPDFPMCLIYTSGSTGLPKACNYPIGRGHTTPGSFVNLYGLTNGPKGDRYYICMPLYHGTANCTAITCMQDGITLCIGKKFSTSQFWTDIRDSDATCFIYVGEAARYLLQAPPSPRDKDHKVKRMFGNGLRPDVWQRFTDRFGIDTVAEFFNSTEGVFGLLNVSRGPFFQAHVGHHGGIMRWRTRNYFIAAEIDHDTGDLWRDPKTGFGRQNPLSKGGEIIVAVPEESLFAGYWNNKEATDKKFVRNLFKEGDLYYRTGDALRRLPDGRWLFMDRLGDTYRWKSENVATAEVSECLGHFPGLAEAIVYGVTVPGHDGRAGCAAIHLDTNNKPSPSFMSDLYKYATKSLPKYAVPVFLRLQPGAAPMHNQKQNKPPLKRDGIDLNVVYGPDKDLKEAQDAGKDVMYWAPSALGLKAPLGYEQDAYVPFRREDWETVKKAADPKVAEQARL